MPEIQSRLRAIRERRKLPAAELAKAAGVSRQTIYAIEDGTFIPNTAIALRLGRVLGASVEEIFPLAEGIDMGAELLTSSDSKLVPGQPVQLCPVGERMIALPVSPVSSYLPAADGIIEAVDGAGVRVKSLTPLPDGEKILLIAGCDPALSFFEQLFRPQGFRVVTVPCSSRMALDWLKQRRVHVAGSHLRDAVSGEYNLPDVRRLFPKGGVIVVTFAAWEQGLVTGRGNPKAIRSVGDLGRKGVSIINRQKGSGSRSLLDSGLKSAGIQSKAVTGYDRIAEGHLPAAYGVASGSADCCVATRSAARCFGLEFSPLAAERFDLVMMKTTCETPAGAALLDVLNRSGLRQKLRTIAGYDTGRTGAIVM